MLELAVREGDGPVPISAIATAQGIPSRFLEAILRQLKQAGLTASLRGKDGGYYLAKPARTLTLGTIIRLFEGPTIGTGPTEHLAQDRAATHIFSEVWQKAEEALAAVYDGTTLGELAERERMKKSGGVADYAI
jgi:Rrf2 family protein